MERSRPQTVPVSTPRCRHPAFMQAPLLMRSHLTPCCELQAQCCRHSQGVPCPSQGSATETAACPGPWGFVPCAERAPILSPFFLCSVTRLRGRAKAEKPLNQKRNACWFLSANMLWMLSFAHYCSKHHELALRPCPSAMLQTRGLP